MANNITIPLSQAAREASLKAGMPVWATLNYPIPTELVARALALPSFWRTLDEGGYLQIKLQNRLRICESGELREYSGYSNSSVNAEAQTVPLDGEAALAHAESVVRTALTKVETFRKEHAEREAQRAAEEKASRTEAERWAALPVAERIDLDGRALRLPTLKAGSCRSYVPSAVAEAEAFLKAEVAKIAQAQRDKERLEDLAALQSVETSVSEALVDRYEAGVLPEAELRQALLAHYLQVDGAFTNYGINDLDPEGDHASEDGTDVAVVKTEPLDELSAEEWRHLKAVRVTLLKEATAEAVLDLLECDVRSCRSHQKWIRRIRVERKLPSGRKLTQRIDL